MRESRPDDAAELGEGADVVSGDALAARLRAAQQALVAIDPDSELRMRLNIRFMSICTSLKLPGASIERAMRRLDQLLAEAKAAGGQAGKEV